MRAAQQRSPCGSEISVSAFHGQKIRPEPSGQRWRMSNLDVYKLRHVDQGEVCHQVRHCATPNTIANISNLSFVDKGRAPISRLSIFHVPIVFLILGHFGHTVKWTRSRRSGSGRSFAWLFRRFTTRTHLSCRLRNCTGARAAREYKMDCAQ